MPPSEVATFVHWFESQPSARERFRWVLRDSLDELLDGQRTGRWAYGHLTKTERTYLGTAIEVNLTREFDIPDGDDLDWKVAAHDLDCKFSKELGGWEIPMEMYLCRDHEGRSGKADHPAMLVWMDDDTSHWAVGILQITDARLRWKVGKDGIRVRAYNRDNKRRIADATRPDIYWLWGGIRDDLPQNLLLHLDADIREVVLRAGTSGQERVDELFARVRGRVISRAVVLTVAQQDDAPKRARDARLRLRPRGIVVLGHQENHPLVARALGLPRPEKGEWVSVRLVRVDEEDPRPKVWVGEYRDSKGTHSAAGWWAIAWEDEPEEAGPIITAKVTVAAGRSRH
ncbi:MAG: NaeI family type II restriction endonuclease [Mycobacteriaceae bacterium]